MNDVLEPKTKTSIDKALYQNLIKFCPQLPKMQEGEYNILKAPRKEDITIGCVNHATLYYPNGIYQIEHSKEGEKATLTIEVAFKQKAATAMTLKIQGKTIDIDDKYFYKLLKDIERSGYQGANRNAAFERT